MKVIVSCSWCQEDNEVPRGALGENKIYCWSCGHRADVPQSECDCRKCRRVEESKGRAA